MDAGRIAFLFVPLAFLSVAAEGFEAYCEVDRTAPFALSMFRQVVTTEWSDAEAASKATAELVLFGPDERFAFSARWDDRNPRSLALARALSPAGLRSTFYVCGTGTGFDATLRELVSLGNSIGCHTLSHDYMGRMLPVKSFREILQNRIELEVSSQTPVVAFGVPYGWKALESEAAGFDNVKVVGEAVHNAGLLGGTEGDGNSADRFGLFTNEWVGSHVFFANDRNPDEKMFWGGLAYCTNMLSRKMPGCGPHISLGLHPWQSDEGLVRLSNMVAKAISLPGVVPMTDNEYIARRLQFLHSRLVRVGSTGRTASFAVERPLPSALGAAVPLKLQLSDGRCLDVPVPPEYDLPAAFSRVDGALSVSEGDDVFTLNFTNALCAAMEDVSFTLRLPPGYEPGVLVQKKRTVAPGRSVRLTFASRVPTHPLFREGTLYAAVEINARGTRIWAPLVKRRGNGEPIPYPRDTALFLGPMLLTNAPSAQAFAEMSVPGGRLVGDWRSADGSAEDDAAWAVTGYRRGDGPRVRKYAGWDKAAPGLEKAYALAFDFKADTVAHGREWVCVFTGGHVKPKNVSAWLNGDFRPNPAGTLRLRNGVNRLVVLLSDIDAEMYRTVLDIRSAKDGTSAFFLRPSP